MKRILPLMLVLALLCTSAVAFAESEEPSRCACAGGVRRPDMT